MTIYTNVVQLNKDWHTLHS